jgi:hypothetical protein
MKIIAKKDWEYVLFDTGTEWILTVLMGGVAEYGVSIALTDQEIDETRREPAFIGILAHNVKYHFETYRARQLLPARWPVD